LATGVVSSGLFAVTSQPGAARCSSSTGDRIALLEGRIRSLEAVKVSANPPKMQLSEVAKSEVANYPTAVEVDRFCDELIASAGEIRFTATVLPAEGISLYYSKLQHKSRTHTSYK
jgi:hypothetical protein